MNWGTKIVLGLGTFMIFIVCAAIYMVSNDTDTLEEDDYYEKGLSYDDVYDRKQNMQDDDAKPTIQILNDTLSIVFKSQQIKGNLNLKRPSDGSLDKVIPLFTSTNVYKLPVTTLTKGNWAMEINWEKKKKKYVDNQSIYIN